MNPRRSWPERMLLVINVLAISGALFAAWALSAGERAVGSINRWQLDGTLTERDEPSPDGGIAFNVLLVGYDSASNLAADDPIQLGRKGEQFADVIIIARIDESLGTAQLLSIPRDLWVPIAGLGEERKINQAFAVGGAPMLIDTIEENLGIPINNFVSVDLSGFEGLVSVVDHVNLYFEYPSRDFNENPPSGRPRSMSGFSMPSVGCQSLDPSSALAFARSRNFQILDPETGDWIYDIEQSDLSRIRRQQTFLEAFIGRAIDLGARNPFVLSDLVNEAVKYVTIDQELTPQMLLDLGRTFESFEPTQLQSYSLPTRYDFVGRESVVFLREDELEPLVLLMEGVPDTEPRTVGVTILADPEASDDALETAAALTRAGFALEDPQTTNDAAEGVTVEFGPDGRQAADLVAATLTEMGVEITMLTENPEIRAREVVVTVGPAPALPPPSTPTSTPEAGSTTTATGPKTTGPKTTQDGATIDTIVVESLESVRSCP